MLSVCSVTVVECQVQVVLLTKLSSNSATASIDSAPSFQNVRKKLLEHS